jgi:hypothetical protein
MHILQINCDGTFYVYLKSKQRLIDYIEALPNQLNSLAGSEVYCDVFGS